MCVTKRRERELERRKERSKRKGCLMLLEKERERHSTPFLTPKLFTSTVTALQEPGILHQTSQEAVCFLASKSLSVCLSVGHVTWATVTCVYIQSYKRTPSQGFEPIPGRQGSLRQWLGEHDTVSTGRGPD